MAGIGFELKKLFKKKSLSSIFKAYGYTGMITTGPMILGVVLLLGVMILAEQTGLSKHSRDLLVCMITYTLLASLVITSFFSMVVTRYIADMIYEEKEDSIIGSFQGCCSICLIVGGIGYGIFLLFAGIPISYVILTFVLFCELIVVWLAMNYLTAIKDYKGILYSFLIAVIIAFLSTLIFVWVWGVMVEAFLLGITIGYGSMMVVDVYLLFRYFPKGKESSFFFLRWFDEYRPLAYIGLFTTVGLFAHLVIAWMGPIGEQVQGLFYGAPMHDVPALIAFFSILITTINFVVSVEVNFYPKYRQYYSLFNEKGSVKDIMQVEEEMLQVLDNEILYTARKQLYTTALMISIGLLFIEKLPLGFNDTMEGYFRTLCVGYGMYAVANTIMLILLYFTDYKGALWATLGFASVSIVASLLSLGISKVYYGFGFALGAGVFYLIGWLRLRWFTQKLPYHILSTQPIVSKAKYGIFSKVEKRLRGRVKEVYEE